MPNGGLIIKECGLCYLALPRAHQQNTPLSITVKQTEQDKASGNTFEVLDSQNLLLAALLLAQHGGFIHTVGRHGKISELLTLHHVRLSADFLVQVRAIRRS